MLVGCEEGMMYDYTTAEFEEALSNGEDVVGKIVYVEVNEVVEGKMLDVIINYHLKAGENLTFVSSQNPEVEAGDSILITVENVGEVFGTTVITYQP